MDNLELNNNNFELEQMETYVMFIDSIDKASKALDHLSSAIVHLDFTNPQMIQKYYNSLSHFVKGIECLKLGFCEYAGSHNINLEEIKD